MKTTFKKLKLKLWSPKLMGFFLSFLFCFWGKILFILGLFYTILILFFKLKNIQIIMLF
jgi:hypothetical protein